MWPGEQQPNPYQQPHQPGHHQPNPYAQQPAQPWNAPMVTAGGPVPEPGGPSGGRTKLVAIVAATAVVVTAGVTGFLLLGGGDGKARPEPTESGSPQASSGGARSGAADKATVAGWKVVVNPDIGVAFDVPADWAPQDPDWVSYVAEDDDPQEKPLVAMKAPAFLQERWCGSDDDKDGDVDYSWLAAAGSRGARKATSTEEIARADSRAWVYGGYAQPDEKAVTEGPVSSYTTKSGITGSLGSASSAGVEKAGSDKCDTDGKATTFAFKNAEGDFVSWSFVGAEGVSDEVPDVTVKKILSTVRLYGAPTGG